MSSLFLAAVGKAWHINVEIDPYTQEFAQGTASAPLKLSK